MDPDSPLSRAGEGQRAPEEPQRVVIADAGPLIGLARIGQLDLLRRLFGAVHVTQQVAEEVLDGGNFREVPTLRTAFAQGILVLVQDAGDGVAVTATPSEDSAALVQLFQIDRGEASALMLARHPLARARQPLLLIDDQRGRAAAHHLRLATIGTAGVLLLARRTGLLPAVAPVLRALRQEGYFLSDSLIEQILTQAGESVV